MAIPPKYHPQDLIQNSAISVAETTHMISQGSNTPSNASWKKSLFLFLTASAATGALIKLYKDGYFTIASQYLQNAFQRRLVKTTETGTQTEISKSDGESQTETKGKSTSASDVDSCGSILSATTSPHERALPIGENGNPRLFSATSTTTQAVPQAEKKGWLGWFGQ